MKRSYPTWARRLRHSVLFLVCVFVSGPFAFTYAASPIQGMPREAALAQERELHNWLYSEFLFESLFMPVSVNLTEQEKAAIDHAPRLQVPVKVGMGKIVNEQVNFASFNRVRREATMLRDQVGVVGAADDGGFVYSLTLRSPDALGMRVHFTDFALPDSAELYLFTNDGQVAGPYWGRGPLGTGEFWSHTLFSEQVMLQLRHYGPAPQRDLLRSGFHIAALGHIRPVFQQGFCDFNADCVENAECSNDPIAKLLRDSTALMLFQSGAFFYICTGGLIADTDESSEVPYFLTARHCISKNREAQSLETYFQFTAPCGTTGGPACSFPSDPPNTLGSSIVASGNSSDYSLLLLAQQPPADSHFLGWNPTPVAFNDGTMLQRISHPQAAPQAYSEHEVDTGAVTCGGLPRGNFIYSRDVFGATEGGSSGSPVVDANGDVVGQLYGACGFNIGDVCDADSNATVDGAFAAYFSQIEDILDPQGCPATETLCDDGLDNDCDGLIDLDDGDCDAGGGDGLPAGSPCESDSECASGKCRGRPGAMICR